MVHIILPLGKNEWHFKYNGPESIVYHLFCTKLLILPSLHPSKIIKFQFNFMRFIIFRESKDNRLNPTYILFIDNVWPGGWVISGPRSSRTLPIGFIMIPDKSWRTIHKEPFDVMYPISPLLKMVLCFSAPMFNPVSKYTNLVPR